MPSYSRKSSERLGQCCDEIQDVQLSVIERVDHSIITGHRPEDEQNDKFDKGYSKVRWPNGKHNKMPSDAIDIAPYVPPYGVITGHPNQIKMIMELRNKSRREVVAYINKVYARLIGNIERECAIRNIPARFGLDWDGDWDMLDQSFHDLGHWEVVR